MKQAITTICVASLVGSAVSAQAFELIEINDGPNPNHPNLVFERHPISFTAVETGGMSVVDFDNDGFEDVFITDTEGYANQLWVNQGNGTFLEEGAARGVAQASKRRGATAMFDMDNDGDHDLLAVGYPSSLILNFDFFTLFRNNGAPNWNFTDVTASAGGFQLAPTVEGTILGEPGGLTVGDYDGNGYLDFFVAFWYRSATFLHDQPRLFRNDLNTTPIADGQQDYSKRKFFDASIQAGFNAPVLGSYWMPTFFDFDRDGYLDLHLNIEYGLDQVRLNNGDGTFGPNIAVGIGMNGDPAEYRNEMGIAFGDVDYDLDFETYHTNAGKQDRFYRNDTTLGEGGTHLAYTDVAPINGTAATIIGFGAAFGDMDLDGDLDLLAVTSVKVPDPNIYLENQWPDLSADGQTPLFIDKTSGMPDFWKAGPQYDIARGLVLFDYDNDGDLDAIVSRPGLNPALNPGTHFGTGFFMNDYSGTGKFLKVDLVERQGSRNTVGARVYVQSGGRIHMREIMVGVGFIAQGSYRQHFGLGDSDIDWVAVRWLGGEHTVRLAPASNITLPMVHGPLDLTGDMNGDTIVDAEDLKILELAIRRPKAVDKLYDHWPWEILGDINGDSTLDSLDLDLLEDLIGPDGSGAEPKIELGPHQG